LVLGRWLALGLWLVLSFWLAWVLGAGFAPLGWFWALGVGLGFFNWFCAFCWLWAKEAKVDWGCGPGAGGCGVGLAWPGLAGRLANLVIHSKDFRRLQGGPAGGHLGGSQEAPAGRWACKTECPKRRFAPNGTQYSTQ
jgi:hypothetical protein